MSAIAVTGATGFVGGFVANYLESKGYKVYRFGRKDMKGVLRWDISEGPYPRPLAIDSVVHCAACVDDWASYARSYSANVLGTQNVLESFKNTSQFIYISSASVYNAFCRQVTISENECLDGSLLNAYSKTKLLGEKDVEKSNILSRVILRPHIIYGPGDTTIGPRIRQAIKFGYLPIPGDGKNRISFTHVENLAQAILKSIEISKSGISIYNVTDSEPITLSEALKQFKSLNHLNFEEFFIPRKLCFVVGYVLEFFYRMFGIKRPPLLTRYIVDQMSSDHIFDISKAKKELGYSPTKNTKEDFLI